MKKYLTGFLLTAAMIGISLFSYYTYFESNKQTASETKTISSTEKVDCFQASIATIRLLHTIKEYDLTIQSSFDKIGDTRYKWGELQLAFTNLHEEFQALHLKNQPEGIQLYIDATIGISADLIKAFREDAQINMEIANFLVSQAPHYKMSESGKEQLAILLNRQTTAHAQLKMMRDGFAVTMDLLKPWSYFLSKLDDTRKHVVYDFILTKFQSVIDEYQSKTSQDKKVLMKPIEWYVIYMYHYLQNNYIDDPMTETTTNK